MNFSDRTYPDIVRDLLTVLTGGTAAETHTIGAGVPDLIHLDNRPVSRISHLQGRIMVGENLTPYRFTERDFELVGTEAEPEQYVALRFRPGGVRPAPGTQLTVNYYPVRLRPTPLTDVNVGSVIRTLLETVSRELATQYHQLQRVYESAFVETAKGESLDRVAAIVSTPRLRRGHPVGKVQFSRLSGSPGEVFIPVLTSVSDGSGNRYLTSHEANLLPNQATVEVWVHGQNARTEPVEARQLTVLERAIAGIDRVSNPDPTYRATEDETDEQYRPRVRRAIHATGKGTPDALRYGLEALPFVSSVALVEFPDPSVAVPGIIQVDVALSEDNEINRRTVDRRLEELRPAGILLRRQWAGRVIIGLRVELVLAGSSLPASSLAELKADMSERMQQHVRSLGPGGTIRRARLVSLALEDDRVVDARVEWTADGTAVTGDTWSIPSGKTAGFDSTEPVAFEIEFEAAAGPAAPSLVQIDADLTVTDLTVTSAALETSRQRVLEEFVSSLQPGDTVTFDQLATVLRDDAQFALVRSQSVIAFDAESQGFTELRDNDPPFTVPPGSTLRVRAVRVQEALP